MILGGATALVSVTPASATIPGLGSVLGDQYKNADSYANNGGCGTLEIVKSLGLDLSWGSKMSTWDMPDHGSVDEITAEVDTDGDGRSDKKVKVGKDRLLGKKMDDGLWGGSHLVGGKKQYWLASSDKGWNIVKSYATVCSGVAMYVAMNCLCGYGVLGGWMYGYDDDGRDHDKGRDEDKGRDHDKGRDDDRDRDRDRDRDKGRDHDDDDYGRDHDDEDDYDYDHDDDCDDSGKGRVCSSAEHIGDYDDEDDDCVDTGKGLVCRADDDDEDYDYNTLPVTGLALGGVAGIGALLAAGGALALVATRRRRAARALL
ncbi:hypothetical protein GCM10010123_35230 [Pilimelia anulata]|uniref:Uncharacterized protein n=1 Tax=Pilimelia anulata TaxID=53371 RepID=A0A8J3FBM1_9ACTN|nr:hypothetical protein GCM10010123_35230 [Pilimelia anulata]